MRPNPFIIDLAFSWIETDNKEIKQGIYLSGGGRKVKLEKRTELPKKRKEIYVSARTIQSIT